jgi:meso-butanediol dehydrogenase/(S,S)-butanediol dehydrogenase/diacetyl reductase
MDNVYFKQIRTPKSMFTLPFCCDMFDLKQLFTIDMTTLAADLNGKTAIVTGGATGIGRAIATALARHGVRVAIADLNGEAARQTALSLGKGAQGFSIDVSKRAEVEKAFAEIEKAFGAYDILIANAGVSTMNRAVDLTDEEWDFNFAVNIKGVFLTNQAAVRYFLKTEKKGVIVNTASLAAKVGAPLLAHYSASKFAVLGWTQALAREVAAQGIRVNAVCPGFVKTSMQEREVAWEAKLRGLTAEQVIKEYVGLTPLGRLEEPEDVAGLAVFLCSDAARFMTGQGINVTGGVYMG